MQQRTTTRRMGPVGSDNWHAMLDCAEATLLEEGYGALTSRRIAERAGVKQRLVYYYFRTMDELIVETFRRMSARELERMRSMFEADMPLRKLWDVCIHTTDSRVTSEFMALAYRNDELLMEVIEFIEGARRIQSEAIAHALDKAGVKEPLLDPNGMAMLATSVALSITREEAIGVTLGHGTLLDLVDAFLDRVEPSDSKSKT